MAQVGNGSVVGGATWADALCLAVLQHWKENGRDQQDEEEEETAATAAAAAAAAAATAAAAAAAAAAGNC